MAATRKRPYAPQVQGMDVLQVRQMGQLLDEVQHAYTNKVASEQERFVSDLDYAVILAQRANQFVRTMLEDYWRTPAKLRPDVHAVIAASGMSKARIYQIRKIVEARGELGPEEWEA